MNKKQKNNIIKLYNNKKDVNFFSNYYISMYNNHNILVYKKDGSTSNLYYLTLDNKKQYQLKLSDNGGLVLSRAAQKKLIDYVININKLYNIIVL